MTESSDCAGKAAEDDKPSDPRDSWVFFAPLAVYMIAGSLEPAPDAGETASLSYPAAYAIKIAATLAVMAWLIPAYRRLPLRVNPWSFVWGAAGVVLWIALVRLGEAIGVDRLHPATWFGHSGGRAAFNPFDYWEGNAAAATAFLALRFLGLAAVIPVIEEFFLRGFVVRIADHNDWLAAPIGPPGRIGWIAVIVLPILMHPPHEALAAAAWFGLATLWVARTKNLWDAVAIHAVTNLLLGVYVIVFGAWSLW